jgi:hypothetical protein
MMPGWATELGKALRTNGLRWNGRKIVGIGERPNLSNWWFHYPERAARRWFYGIREHGVRRWVELSRESWKFNREWRRRQ